MLPAPLENVQPKVPLINFVKCNPAVGRIKKKSFPESLPSKFLRE